jgi:hypothetical protein
MEERNGLGKVALGSWGGGWGRNISRSHCIAQASLKLVIILPQPPECWDYRLVPPLLDTGSFGVLLSTPKPHGDRRNACF